MMSFEKMLQTCTFWQLAFTKPVSAIPFQPSVESPITVTFQGEQNADGHEFAWIQFRLRMFTNIPYIIIHFAENTEDNISSTPGVLLGYLGGIPMSQLASLVSKMRCAKF